MTEGALIARVQGKTLLGRGHENGQEQCKAREARTDVFGKVAEMAVDGGLQRVSGGLGRSSRDGDDQENGTRLWSAEAAEEAVAGIVA